MDMTMLGQLTAALMEEIDEHFEDTEDASVRTAMLLVEIDSPKSTYFRVVCNDDRPWFQLAFLEEQRERMLRILDEMESDSAAPDDD